MAKTGADRRHTLETIDAPSSGDFPGSVAERSYEIQVTPERSNVLSYDVNAGHLAMLDLGDASLADSQGMGEFSLSDTSGLTDLGELESADVCFAAFTRDGFSSGAFRLVSRVEPLWP